MSAIAPSKKVKVKFSDPILWRKKPNEQKNDVFLTLVKHNKCMNNPLRHKKLIKNQIKSSKLTYDNTFTNKKPRKTEKFQISMP